MLPERSLFMLTAETDVSPPPIDQLFEKWWRQYPRKADKGAARKAFKRVLAQKLASFDELLAGAMGYAAERAGEDPRFTKHGATWLNAESWANEPLTRSSPARSNFVSGAIAGIASRVREVSRVDSAIEGLFEGLTEEDFE